MKANEVYVNNMVADKGDNRKTGRIVSNFCRLGDELIIVEWDNDFFIEVMNVNNVISLPYNFTNFHFHHKR